MVRLRVGCSLVLVAIAATLPAACVGSDPSTGGPAPPRAEFLISSDDSTFWVSTATGEARTRGAPLVLARYGGRFYELYTAEDDFSYPDAQLLGERLYRRDLLTGDSAVVFADTVVARVARSYARSHPNERPLEPNEEAEADPATTATAEVDILEVFGPYLSYEYHVDIEAPGQRLWHSTRRGVLDLRSGKEARIEDLFGQVAGKSLESSGRRVYEGVRDSILEARGGMTSAARRAADVLEHLRFDPRSFSLTDIDGRPAVTFGVPGSGEGPAGHLVELNPIKADSAAWWGEVARGLPTSDDDGNGHWQGANYRVLARYDTTGEIARLSIGDSTRREWPLATITGPLHHIDWLDRPAIPAADRTALSRAFNESAAYGGGLRAAANAPTTNFSLVSRSNPSHASIQARQRESARDVRAHDARACQQPRPRVRRCDSIDDGQVRGDRRLSAQPRERRDCLDRPRRLPRVDSPRRSGRHEGERELRGALVDGNRCQSRGGRAHDRPKAAHQLMLSDLRCG